MKKYERRTRTVGLRRLKKMQKEDIELAPPGANRPRWRSQCEEGPRPCPYVACRYNLFLDITAAGSIHYNQRAREPLQMSESCALDVADRGGATLREIAHLLGVTRERVRQIEDEAASKLAANLTIRERALASRCGKPALRLGEILGDASTG